jgi:Tfp pilus assembly protein PilV
MRTFPFRINHSDRPLAPGDGPPAPCAPRDRPLTPGGGVSGGITGEGGFALIEVITSALLVGLIVMGTLSGFEAADSSSTNDKLQNEAAVLAAQSQDQLRSAPASALEILATSPHTYTQVADGVTFTIKQEARFVGGPEGSSGCSVTEHKSQITNALRITSTVSWERTIGKAAPVVESSVVTPPTGSALQVDVGNAPAATAGVSGVLVVVKYTAAGSSTVSTLEATTPNAGCVVFGAIPATAATVEIPEQANYVRPNGTQYIAPEEVTLAPNTTTYHEVTYQRGSAITAEFTYKEATKYTHANNKGESESEEVLSDTFVVTNSDMKTPPDYEVGSTHGELMASNLYQPIPGSPTSQEPYWYQRTSTSPETTKYTDGNLFPFPESEGEGQWTAFAGDCLANDPKTLGIAEAPLEQHWIAPATPKTFKVPVSRLSLNVYKGTEGEVNALGSQAAKDLETSHAHLVTIIDKSCAGVTQEPNNETGVSFAHTQDTTTGEAKGGHLEFPFQPFGAYELCVYEETSRKTYTVTGEDLSFAGTSQNIFLKQRSTKERAESKASEEAKEKATENTRKSEEASTKAARETSEAPAKEKREKEEATEKSTREKQEAAQTKWQSEEATEKSTRETQEKEKATREKTEEEERKKWKSQEEGKTSPKISKEERKQKEKTQTKTREADEAAEKTAREKRESEEATTKATREKEEAAKVTREKEEAATKTTRTKEEEARAAAVKKEEEKWNARKTEEANTKAAREKRETEEAKEGAKVAVESEKAGCPT